MKILVVDDRKIDRESLMDLLEAYGYAVAGASSGQEAIDYLNNNIDLALIDIVMPEMDGIEVLKAIKAFRPDIDVILITAYATLEKAVAGLKEGAYDFLSKPFTHNELIAAVERVKEKKELQMAVKSKEDSLRKSERFLHSVLESIGEAVVVIDRDMKIVSANKGYKTQTKMLSEDITGRHCYEISHGYPKPCYLMGEDCAVMRTFDDGLAHTAIHIHKDKDGNPLFVETNSYPLIDDKGKVYAVVETIKDITEIKKLEEEKQKIEEQLIQAQKMESIGTLAGGIAHDFNNMLTAILGFGGLIQSNMAEDDPNLLYLKEILKAAERAAHLTQGLLTFSRKQIINPKPENINNIVASVRKMLERLIGEDIELKTILADEELIVMADSGQIEQVLMNLATNARDAMPDGGILTIMTESLNITQEFIRMHGYGEQRKYAVISVSDTGKGMDEKTRKRIFEPFFTTKELGRGTGLGLAIVYGIVKQHHGYVNCYSEPDRGTTFKIYLPLKSSTYSKDEESTLPPPERGHETILLAEDYEPIRKLMKDVFEMYGYTVIDAVDGMDAVDKFKRHKDDIDIIIMDVIMPRKNGKEAYDDIKSIKDGIPCIFMSGYSADIIGSKGLSEKDSIIISKPVMPDDLLRKIRHILNAKGKTA